MSLKARGSPTKKRAKFLNVTANGYPTGNCTEVRTEIPLAESTCSPLAYPTDSSKFEFG